MSLATLINEMQKGDRLIIEVSKVRRINFKNKSEDISILKYYETIASN